MSAPLSNLYRHAGPAHRVGEASTRDGSGLRRSAGDQSVRIVSGFAVLRPQFTLVSFGCVLSLVLAAFVTLSNEARAANDDKGWAANATFFSDIAAERGDGSAVASDTTPTRRMKALGRLGSGQYKRSVRARSHEQDDAQSGEAVASLPQGPLYVRLWRAINSPLVYRGLSLTSIRFRILTVLECLRNYGELRCWHRKAHDPRFAWMVERHPLFPADRTRPYINASWSMQERRAVLETHYTMLNGAARILHFSPQQSVDLISLDEVEEGVRLTLDKPRWFADEGEVAMNLFSGDTRIFSLVFTLGQRDGRRIAYVGAIQGKPGGNGLEENRRLTRAAHAMRPRDLLFAAFRMLCKHLQIDAILAIDDAHNICHSAYFDGIKRKYVLHDSTWQEYRGVMRTDGFFEIAVPVPYREAKDVPARKRALYRRRYEMLHRIDTAIAERLRNNDSKSAT